MLQVSQSVGLNRRFALVEGMTALVLRVRGEYREMPGLHLTVPQAARLFGVTDDVAHAVLETLRQKSVLTCSALGQYSVRR